NGQLMRLDPKFYMCLKYEDFFATQSAVDSELDDFLNVKRKIYRLAQSFRKATSLIRRNISALREEQHLVRAQHGDDSYRELVRQEHRLTELCNKNRKLINKSNF